MPRLLLKITSIGLFFCTGILAAVDNIYVVDQILVDIEGTGSPRRVRDVAGIRRGQRVSEKDIRAAVDRIAGDGRYRQVSYEVLPSGRETQKVLFRLVVDPGFKPAEGITLCIDEVEITGNWKTNDTVILGQLYFRLGEEISRNEIDLSMRELFDREYFFELDWGLYREENRIVMEIRVREKWTTFPVVYVRGDDGRTELMLGVMDANLLGLGLSLRGNFVGTYYSDSPARHDLQFYYDQRRVGGTALAIDAEGGSYSEFVYVNDDGIRIDAFSRRRFYLDSVVSWYWTPEWNTGLLIDGRYDLFSDAEALAKGFTGYDFEYPNFGVGICGGYDGINLYDQRRSGEMIYGELEYFIPTSSPVFWYGNLELEFHRIFWSELMNLSARLKGEYSSAQRLPYQINRFEYLRGASGREIWSPLVFGANLELGISPIRQNWLFLEILGFLDLSWGSENLPDLFSQTAMLRFGPGLRISFPPIARMYLSLDLVFTENGANELYFGMIRFF